MPDDTIFALSSGAPPVAIAVLRVSGPHAGPALDALTGRARPDARRAVRRRLHDAAGTLLDDALVLWLPGPDTVSGEDMAELHLHGGRAVIAAVSAALDALPGLRPAEAGEFTRRALGNGRVDLAQAEGLATLLAAETEAQRRAALRATEGGVGREVGGWLARLTAIAATIEAQIDYADEGDVASNEEFRAELTDLAAELDAALARPPVERLHDGLRVVLAGPPNAGKSSLLNALAERDLAIATPIAGTTRDIVETTVTRDGAIFVLSDTAGLIDESDDAIELLGVTRARAAIETSDLLLWLGDDPPPTSDALWLYPRADLRPAAPPNRIAVSIHNRASVASLWCHITAANNRFGVIDSVQFYNRRQRDHAARAAHSIHQAASANDFLIVAEEVRAARRSLGALLGYDETEAMLDALFARFCVGK